MPGCWDFKVSNINALNNRISWRFCGGFFLGDKESLLHFYNISITHFTEFLNLTKKLVWEVNYWSWLEGNEYFEPILYAANHNDSIVNISERILVKTILLEADGIIEYDYPTIMTNDKFFASSASYIYDKITNNDLLMTLKIALAHFNESGPKYYKELKKMEYKLSKKWKNNTIFL
jgi:hypothetical protein